jgi:hypothetical protein
MTYTELKKKWDETMEMRDRAIRSGVGQGIEGSINFHTQDCSTFIAVINVLITKLAEEEQTKGTP